ncbi:acyl-ACP thioesterase [Algoriphagus kandeliae]|uniref:Acyl-ACP thioesterase n=1 Tax=Algoriphagus kandeliae TaxID=2562278 RepID=A0A4Y9QRZ5_9BACT|nr:acyl-ACP thioesterase domain-containing protein [Algoriphagus kandeliae]TFV94608.1 acyl-ACP thioesterase [Algoriphagus kandeliae]
MSAPETFQFHHDFEIGSFQVNPSGNLRLKDLADLFQEAAWRHADSGDFGRNLQKENRMWVLSRLEIKVNQMPVWGDEVRVYTAGRGVEGLFAFREFLMVNSKEEELARGISSWVLLDAESKRIVKPGSVLPPELFKINQKPDWIPEKHRIRDLGANAFSIKVQPSDLDLQNHVNNTSYIRWVEDGILEKSKGIQFLSINYLAECFLRDEVSIFKSTSDQVIQLVGKVEEKTVFSAKVQLF